MGGNAALDAPVPTMLTTQRFALCAAFLTTYYSGGGSANAIDAPVPAIVTKARHGLVTVDIDGTTYALADIRLRMLKPAELARAQGFPADYSLTGTQAQQIGRIGNSVCPPVAQALVRANLVGGKAVAA
jgi:DNA (cytosine-5)-methyltransferase 1